MTGGNGTAAALALGAGLAGSMQVAVMGRFGDRIGSLEAPTSESRSSLWARR